MNLALVDSDHTALHMSLRPVGRQLVDRCNQNVPLDLHKRIGPVDPDKQKGPVGLCRRDLLVGLLAGLLLGLLVELLVELHRTIGYHIETFFLIVGIGG